MKRLPLLTLFLVFLPFAAEAASPPPAPGRYRNWDNRIEDLQVVAAFHLKDYAVVEVLPPDVSSVAVPTDNTRDAVRRTLVDATRIISDELDSQFPNRLKVKAEALLNGMVPPARSLGLRTRFVTLDPGSRSKRGLSFGNAGKASVVLSGELIDLATNQPLLRFTVRNDDGSHGDYEHVLQENLEHAVDRIARAIKAFYP